MEYLKKNRIKNCTIIISFILLMGLSSYFMEVDYIAMFAKLPAAFSRFNELYFPPDFSAVGEMLEQLVMTIVIAVSGATAGMIFAFFSALSISSKTGRNKVLKYIVRAFASFTRNVPNGIWAVVLLLCFWFGEFLAFIVMSISSYGFLTRVFADSIDETNSNCIEALEATGASYWQIIFHAVVPETLPMLISWGLYSAENNIRTSTIVGMLAGGGIGYLIGIYKHFREFPKLFTAVMLVVLTIIISDQILTQIRKRILV